MPGEDDDEDEQKPKAGGDPAGNQQQTPTGGAPPGAPTEPKQQEEAVLQVKHGDFKKIKDEAREKGRRQALADLDEKAKAVGFTSHDDALRALAELKKTPPAAAQTATQPTPPIRPKEPQPMPKTTQTQPKPDAAADRERLRAHEDRQKMRKQWRTAEQKRRELEKKLQAKEAEMGLREECFQSGVKDVDYTIRLLTRELEGKTQEEIAKFDRKAFYGKLRAEKPYLFGEQVAPATTGTDPAKPAGSETGAAPTTPAPGASTAEEASKTKFDAMKAKPEEVQARLRSLGLNPQL